MNKDLRPFWLKSIVSTERFLDWLTAEAQRAFNLERANSGTNTLFPCFIDAILVAVRRTEGLDELSRMPIDWGLMGLFDNTEAASVGPAYIYRFAAMPIVVRTGSGTRPNDFLVTRYEFREVDASTPKDIVRKLLEIAKTKVITDLFS
jgi:hypothetical protein